MTNNATRKAQQWYTMRDARCEEISCAGTLLVDSFRSVLTEVFCFFFLTDMVCVLSPEARFLSAVSDLSHYNKLTFIIDFIHSFILKVSLFANKNK